MYIPGFLLLMSITTGHELRRLASWGLKKRLKNQVAFFQIERNKETQKKIFLAKICVNCYKFGYIKEKK